MEKENYLKMDQENRPRDPLLVIGYIWYNIDMKLSTVTSGGNLDVLIE